MDMKHTATLDQLAALQAEMLTVGELAHRLGVHPDTVRRWERKGYLKSLRHPMNNYRLFLEKELKEEHGNGELK